MATSLENLVFVPGPFTTNHKKVNLDTMPSASEAMNLRYQEKKPDSKGLRDKCFWTRDFPMYAVEDDEAVLYLNTKINPMFSDVKRAISLLTGAKHYYKVKKRIASMITSDENTVGVDGRKGIRLSELELEGTDDVWRYFEIDTGDYTGLNKAQRAFAEAVYGTGEDFINNMKMLADAKKEKIRIHVLNPEYVKKHARKGPIALVSRLDDFSFNSDFYASGWSLSNNKVGLLGEARRK
ncbi:hypothetical protein JXA85_06935 [Candidatus Woesearchaeota archaeon]|nr:hypothetical protein [Candidatus Woesearchaeota archaeon]